MSRTAGLIALASLISVFMGAADAQVVITQAKALQGGVTPGDAAGFPIILSRPGSYRFGTNIQPPASTIGIELKSPDITIDLNGFRLASAHAAVIGILSTVDRVTIHGGTITGFTGSAISDDGNNLAVENTLITLNGAGIDASPPSTVRVVNNSISVNGGDAIHCYNACQVEGNVLSANDGYGVDIAVAGTVLGNTIVDNHAGGITGQQVVFGNNFLSGNKVPQAVGVRTMSPNACVGGC